MATAAEAKKAELQKQKKQLEGQISKLSKSRVAKSKLKGGTTPEEAEARRRLSDLKAQLKSIEDQLSTVDTLAGPAPDSVTMTPAYALEQLVYTRSALEELRNKKNPTRQDQAKMLDYERSIRKFANIAGVTPAPFSQQTEKPPPGPTTAAYVDPRQRVMQRENQAAVQAAYVDPRQRVMQRENQAATQAALVKMQQNAYGWTQEQQQVRDQIKQIFLSNEIGRVPFQGGPIDKRAAEIQAKAEGGEQLTPDELRYLATPQVLGQYEGYNFGPKQDSADDTRFLAPWGLKGTRDVDALNGMSVKNIYAMFYDLQPQELVTFQRQLMDAGLFDDMDKPPSLGKRDQSTRLALENLMQIWGGSDPDKPIGELLIEMKRDRSKKKRDQINKLLGITGQDGGGNVEIRLTSKDTLEQLIDRVAVDLFGSGIEPERKAELIARMQAAERSQQMALAQRSAKSAARSQIPDFDLFVDALIGQESGGDPTAVNSRTGALGIGQILPGNWDSWAREFGLNPNDMSAENQRRVVESKVASYYLDYGNWDDVASIWYSGQPAGTFNMTAGQGPAGDEPSIQNYIDSIRSRMEQLRSQRMGTGPSYTEYEQFDPQATAYAELKAADPARYIATQFRRQADVFFGMLAGIRR